MLSHGCILVHALTFAWILGTRSFSWAYLVVPRSIVFFGRIEPICFSRFLCLPPVCAVSVLHILCLLAQVVQSVEKHTLGTRFCHIMLLFGL